MTKRQIMARPGDWLVSCDRTGVTRWASECTKEWNGNLVWNRVFEERNQQDFIRGIPDDNSVKDPRPPGTPTFIGPLIGEINATHAAGETALTLLDTTRMNVADSIGIGLDNTDIFRTTIQSVDDATTLTISTPLPGATSAGKTVTNYTAVSPATIE